MTRAAEDSCLFGGLPLSGKKGLLIGKPDNGISSKGYGLLYIVSQLVSAFQ